ncbi:MAG: hypothetical protein DRJ61_17695 [Acidobacteria bacterium]|nr:MAG: hypothetical protein DRJ61_17695 [Acidobacteriota bacterium]
MAITAVPAQSTLVGSVIIMATALVGDTVGMAVIARAVPSALHRVWVDRRVVGRPALGLRERADPSRCPDGGSEQVAGCDYQWTGCKE